MDVTPVEDERHLLVEVEGPVAHLTLNRPHRANALSLALMEDLDRTLAEVASRHDVRVIVLHGAGRGFSAGYDLASRPPVDPDPPENTPSPLTADVERIRQTVERWLRVWDSPKPVIAQVHGYCLAGAFELAMACDFVVVAEDARIGFPPVRAQGVPPLTIYPWLMGMRQAKEFLWTGDLLSGLEAADRGLVNRAVPADRLDVAVHDLAARIALMPSELLLLSKRALHRAYESMGFRASVTSGIEFDAIAHTARAAETFRSIAREEGLSAAVRWRDAPYERGGEEA